MVARYYSAFNASFLISFISKKVPNKYILAPKFKNLLENGIDAHHTAVREINILVAYSSNLPITRAFHENCID